ncbi:SDR family NAD(P)-dependent oxidoreductase, partial [Pseudomonas syringae]
MADQKVWLITGASRGLGVHLAQAALTAGHAVVATGRDPQRVEDAVGAHEDLLTVKLDITKSEDAEAAVTAAISKFGRIDVLVNNVRIPRHLDTQPTIIWTLIPSSLGHLPHVHLDRQ